VTDGPDDERSRLIERAQAHFLRSENDEGLALMAEAKALELPAKGDDGYDAKAWGDRQPDGTVPTVDFVWWQGDVYHDDQPPGYGPYADPDQMAWRIWVIPDEITSGKTPRYRFKYDRNTARMCAQRWPLEGTAVAAYGEKGRATSRANQAAARAAQGDVLARVKAELPAPESNDPIEVGDYVARLCAAVVKDPLTDIPTMKAMTDIAKAWTAMTNQRRVTKALGAAGDAAGKGELTPEALSLLKELQNRVLMRGVEKVAGGDG